MRLKKEKPDYANVIDERNPGYGISSGLRVLGDSFYDGASGLVNDAKSMFRKEDPDALVARKLREATPSVKLSRKK